MQTGTGFDWKVLALRQAIDAAACVARGASDPQEAAKGVARAAREAAQDLGFLLPTATDKASAPEKKPQPETTVLRAGTIIQKDGIPFSLSKDTEVSGLGVSGWFGSIGSITTVSGAEMVDSKPV